MTVGQDGVWRLGWLLEKNPTRSLGESIGRYYSSIFGSRVPLIADIRVDWRVGQVLLMNQPFVFQEAYHVLTQFNIYGGENSPQWPTYAFTRGTVRHYSSKTFRRFPPLRGEDT